GALMLHEDPERTHLQARREEVVTIYESANQPPAQTPGHSAQAAQAAVIALPTGRAFEVLVLLTIPESRETVVYATDPPTPAPPQRRDPLRPRLQHAPERRCAGRLEGVPGRREGGRGSPADAQCARRPLRLFAGAAREGRGALPAGDRARQGLLRGAQQPGLL